ncbi:unnamed protein product, partial [Closterium sp. Naga37s-1]
MRDGLVQVKDVLVGKNAATGGVNVAAGGVAAGGVAAEVPAAGGGNAAAGRKTRVTAAAVFGRGAFEATWGGMQQRMDAVLQEYESRVVAQLQQWVKTSTALHRCKHLYYNTGQDDDSTSVQISPVQITPAGAGMTCKLPTSVVVTGSLDSTDSASFCSALQASLQQMGCCHVVLLEPHNLGGGGQAGSQAVLSVLQQLTGKAGKVPDMAALSAWHQAHTSAGSVGNAAGCSGGACSIAVVVADAPACSTTALHALISVLSEWRSTLPFVLILTGVHSLPSIPRLLPPSTLPHLHLSTFRLPSPRLLLDPLLLSALLQPLFSPPSPSPPIPAAAAAAAGVVKGGAGAGAGVAAALTGGGGGAAAAAVAEAVPVVLSHSAWTALWESFEVHDARTQTLPQ